jgi:hypothetical protein
MIAINRSIKLKFKTSKKENIEEIIEGIIDRIEIDVMMIEGIKEKIKDRIEVKGIIIEEIKKRIINIKDLVKKRP